MAEDFDYNTFSDTGRPLPRIKDYPGRKGTPAELFPPLLRLEGEEMDLDAVVHLSELRNFVNTIDKAYSHIGGDLQSLFLRLYKVQKSFEKPAVEIESLPINCKNEIRAWGLGAMEMIRNELAEIRRACSDVIDLIDSKFDE